MSVSNEAPIENYSKHLKVCSSSEPAFLKSLFRKRILMNLTLVNKFLLCVMAGKKKYDLKGIYTNHILPSKKTYNASFWILTLALHRSITAGAKISSSYWELILGPCGLFLYQVTALKAVGILYAFRFIFLVRRESLTTFGFSKEGWYQRLEQKAKEVPLEKMQRSGRKCLGGL